MKDVNDLLCHGGIELVQKLLEGEPVGKEDLTGADREEIFDQASWMGRDEYDQGREAIAKRLDVRVGTLDEERKARHEKRTAETAREWLPIRTTSASDPSDDPVTDLGAVLDASVDMIGKILAAPDTYLDTQVLWAVHTHLLLRRELGVRHRARLAFQAPFEDSRQNHRHDAAEFLRGAGNGHQLTDRRVAVPGNDAHHWTILWDEADNAFHKNTNPELIGVFNAGHDRRFARVHRQVPSPDGGYETQTFDTFTGIALTMIDEFLRRIDAESLHRSRMKRATKREPLSW